MVKEAISNKVTVFRASDSVVIVDRLANGVVLVTGSGRHNAEIFPQLTQEIETEMFAAKTLNVFIDVTRARGISAKSRDQWASWVKQHRSYIVCIWVMVNSRIIDMALSIASLAVGGGLIQSTTSEREFLTALQKKVSTITQLPRYPQLES